MASVSTSVFADDPTKTMKFTSKLRREVYKIVWNLTSFKTVEELRSLMKTTLPFKAGDNLGFPSQWYFFFIEDTTSNPPLLGSYGVFLKLADYPTDKDLKSVTVQFEIEVVGQDGASLIKGKTDTRDGSRFSCPGGQGLRSILKLTDQDNPALKDNGFEDGHIELTMTLCGSIVDVEVKEEPSEDVALLTHFSRVAICSDLRKLFISGEHSDFTVVIPRSNDEEDYPDEYHYFYVHKAILAARSPVFFAMFEAEMAEGITDCVKIEDISQRAMFIILNFIYTGFLSEDWTEVAYEVVNAAEKYDLKLLKDFCNKGLVYGCTTKNALELRRVARLYELQKALKDINDFIKKNIDEILEYDI